MKLHFRGITVPALGSPRDLVYRDFLIHETKTEASKAEILMLNTMASASFVDTSARKEWDEVCRGAFNKYISLLLGVEVKTVSKKDSEMLKYYQSVVKKTSPKLYKTKQGELKVDGLDDVLK